MSICKCGSSIPKGRTDLGYKVCVNCSDVEVYGCVPVTNHKTGNAIHVLPRSQAAVINKAFRRKGYGTCLR
jgi:hypothetical protein